MNSYLSQLSKVLPTIAIIAILLFLNWSCSGDGIGLDINGNPLAPDTTISFSNNIQPIFNNSCSCHLGAGAPLGLDLSPGKSYNNLVNVPSRELTSLDRIEPANPDTSYLVWKIEGDPRILGERMPLGGPYLNSQTIQLIRKWILQGAQNN